VSIVTCGRVWHLRGGCLALCRCTGVTSLLVLLRFYRLELISEDGGVPVPAGIKSNRVNVAVGDRQITLSNLDKVLWPQQGFTKGDLIEYYAAVGKWLLPHLKDRPLSLVRFPDGITQKGFYQKDAPQGTPDWVRIAPVLSKDKQSYINFILCDNMETLVWMANLGVIEINPWLSRFTSLDNPDFAVFDIDPAEGSTWADVLVVAKLVKQLLDEWKLKGFPKVSGGTGLHIYVPIEPVYTYKESAAFVQFGATLIQQAYPEKVTLERKVKDRYGHVYIDYPQNARGQTILSVYSVKALNGAPVSVPVSWDELDAVGPQTWNIKSAPGRLAQTEDLFMEVLTYRQNISSILQNALSGNTM
jgi:bifunctional non-homologous end joining protein LigD